MCVLLEYWITPLIRTALKWALNTISRRQEYICYKKKRFNSIITVQYAREFSYFLRQCYFKTANNKYIYVNIYASAKIHKFSKSKWFYFWLKIIYTYTYLLLGINLKWQLFKQFCGYEKLKYLLLPLLKKNTQISEKFSSYANG